MFLFPTLKRNTGFSRVSLMFRFTSTPSLGGLLPRNNLSREFLRRSTSLIRMIICTKFCEVLHAITLLSQKLRKSRIVKIQCTSWLLRGLVLLGVLEVYVSKICSYRAKDRPDTWFSSAKSLEGIQEPPISTYFRGLPILLV